MFKGIYICIGCLFNGDFSLKLKIIINIAIGAHGHGKHTVDVLNLRDKKISEETY